SMSRILRQVTLFGGRVVLGVMLFALLTPPFGLRAYLEARAQEQAQASHVIVSCGRPAAAIVTLPVTARPFAQAPRSPLDGVKGKGAWLMIFNGDWNDPDSDRAAAIVDAAVRADLSHLYIRIADSRYHFYGTSALQDLLPIAHQHGLNIIGWIEPMLYWRATGLPPYSGVGGARADVAQVFQQFRDPGVNPFKRPLTITAQAYDAAPEYGTPGAPPGDEIVTSMDETRAQGGISWSYYRLANADNGVTGEEQQAITGYPFWQRFRTGGIAGTALIALPDQPVAY